MSWLKNERKINAKAIRGRSVARDSVTVGANVLNYF